MRREPRKGDSHLTELQRDIVHLIAEGWTNKEIGRNLGLREKAVNVHRAHIMRKLGLTSMAALVRYAVKNRIIAEA